MSHYLDEHCAAYQPEGMISTPFELNRTLREQIKSAVATVQPSRCKRHPNELLPLDLPAMVDAVLHHDDGRERHLHRSIFEVVYSRCSTCPRNQPGLETDVEGCAAVYQAIFQREWCRWDKEKRLLPFHRFYQPLEADRSVLDQNQAWLAKESVFCCPRSQELLHQRGTAIIPSFKLLIFWPKFVHCPQCRLEGLGVLPDDAHASFDNFRIDPPEIRAIYEACRAFANDPKGMLLLLGNVGTGKTHLALAILRELFRRGAGGLCFIKHRDFVAKHWIAQLPVTFRTEQPVSPLAACQNSELLVYDELTAAMDNRHACEDLLLDLFESRIGRFKPTIITGNILPKNLEESIGSRLFDRLTRVATVLEFGIPSKRSSLKQEYLQRHLHGGQP